jgi:hypothetical protein
MAGSRRAAVLGWVVRLAERLARTLRPRGIKRVETASLFALGVGLLGIFGAGHLYLGDRDRALSFFTLSIGLAMLVLVAFMFPALTNWAAALPTLWLVLWIWQAFDARATARRSLAPAPRPLFPEAHL